MTAQNDTDWARGGQGGQYVTVQYRNTDYSRTRPRRYTGCLDRAAITINGVNLLTL